METKMKIEGNWNEIKSKLKEKFSQLTDEDLTFLAGKEEELLGRLARKTGLGREEIIDIFEDLKSKVSMPSAEKSQSAFKIEGNWYEVKSKLKEKFAQLTDEDLGFVQGKEDELLVRLEKKLGKKKEEITSEIDKLQKENSQHK